MLALGQGCQTQFLEGPNPAPGHIPCSFQISLKDLISFIRCVYLGLEINSTAGLGNFGPEGPVSGRVELHPKPNTTP